MAPLNLIEAVAAGHPAATLEVVPGADHGFRAAGVKPEQMLDRLAEILVPWLVGQLPSSQDRSSDRSRS